MNTLTDKTKENKSRAVAKSTPQRQNVGKSTVQFVDNRPVAITQRKLQELIDNGVQKNKATQLKPMEHIKGCGCPSCNTQMVQRKKQIQFVEMAENSYQATDPPITKKVIQGNWVCEECGAKGPGKPKKKCPDCKGPTVEDMEGVKKKFGDWWEELGNERRQQLLRAHGSHEAEGGQNMSGYKGGGKKGNQHDVGVAKAMQAIKVKYEHGGYD